MITAPAAPVQKFRGRPLKDRAFKQPTEACKRQMASVGNEVYRQVNVLVAGSAIEGKENEAQFYGGIEALKEICERALAQRKGI